MRACSRSPVCPTPRTPPSSRAATSPSSAHPWTSWSPSRRERVWPPRDPGRRRASGPAARDRRRRDGGAAGGRLRRRAGGAGRSGRVARGHPAHRAEAVAAGTIPIILGGDHSIAEPDVRACAERFGPLGLLHFDTHTDTAQHVYGATFSHGSPMYRLVEGGWVDPRRYAQVGLRGYWPGPEEFAWQERHGITAIFMHEVRELGIAAALDRALAAVGDGPGLPVGGRRRAGSGVRSRHRHTRARWDDAGRPLWACRERRAPEPRGRGRRRGSPTAIGSADITALVGDRIVREILTGIALRRRGETAAT